MDKMFHVNYSDDDLSGLSSSLEPELLACRACLATDTKLYPLSHGLAEAYECLVGMPITTDFVRSIDRMSHNLLLEFTLGLDEKVIYLTHEDDDDDVDVKENTPQYDDHKAIIDMDDTDGLTDVLNDFEEIRNSLNDEVDINFNDNDFNDINEENDSRNRSFNDHVEGLFNGKEMNHLDDMLQNSLNAKNICNNDIVDIINTEFNGKTVVKKSLEETENLTAVKKALNEEISNTETRNKNMNDNLPEDINFTDVSINTNDLNENDNSNLMDAFNNFILDHDYLDEKFLIETGEADSKKHIISKKTDEESLLREIIPKMTKKEKKLVIKEIENDAVKKPTKPRKKDTDALKNIKKHKNIQLKEDTNGDKSNSAPLTVAKVDIHDDNKELTSDFIKFGDDFNFRIFVLSREEQLEELERKRESVLYLGAPYKCVMCAKGFRSPATHENHMRVHDPSHGAFPCGVCQVRYGSAPRRRRHADTHRLKYCCTRCEFVARTREKAESHFEWHAGRTYACEHCGETFGKVSTQLSHVRLRHPGACAACAACGEAFVGALGLRLHIARKHKRERKSQELAEWYCFSCRLQFGGAQAFARHQAGPGCSLRSHACAECGASCESGAALLQHRRVQHQNATRCHICDASFDNEMSRQTHYERVHLNIKGRKQDSAIRVKSTARANVEKRKVMCEICGNKYHSAAALSYHQRAHSGERPFGCPLCSKSFALNHSLQAHLRTHTGERPHRCPQCARAFRNANNLARHRKTVHLGQKQYSRCSVCRKWLTSPSALRLHAATVHHNAP